MSKFSLKNKIYTCLVLITIICINTSAQNIGILAGINQNHFYDNDGENHNTDSKYEYGYGYCFEVNLSNLYLRNGEKKQFLDSLPFKIALSIESFSGSLYTKSSGHGGYSSTTANIESIILGSKFYPLNFKLWNFKIGLGLESDIILFSKVIGEKKNAQYFSSSYSEEDINGKSINYSLHFGACAYLDYHFLIGKNWYITPQYAIYYGFLGEFGDTEVPVKAIRHYFKIGLTKQF